MDSKNCLNCGLDFPVKKYRATVAKFCSYECYWGKSSNKEQKQCTKCQKLLPISWFRKLNRGWQSSCRDCKSREFKNWTRRNDAYQRFRFYQWSAKRSNRPFGITLEYFKNLILDHCWHYCDSSEDRLGLDRVDSSLGYTEDNIVPCCRRCNVAKSDMESSKFIGLCVKIAKKHGIT